MPGEHQGGFLGAPGRGLVGWIWDPARPHRTIDAEVLCDGVVSGRARAELFDVRLAERGVGNGSHAFRVHLTELGEGTPRELSLRAAGTERVLAALAIDDAAAFEEMATESARYEGFVDGLLHGRIVGWARDRLRPDERVCVDLRDGPASVCSVTADRLRDDLASAGKGDGRHGFEVPLPLGALDGGEHELSVVVDGTELVLNPGPVLVRPGDAPALLAAVVPGELLRQALGRQR